MWVHILSTKLLAGTSDALRKPIFFAIIDKLEDLINDYMTTANGFSADYGSVNQFNPGSRTYPAVFLEYPESMAEEDLQVIERDTEETEIIIRVQAPTSADLDKTAFWVVGDFGYLFESFKNTLKVEGLIQYDLIGSQIDYTECSEYPVEVIMTYRLKYRRQNNDLYTPDTSATADVFSGSAFAETKPIILQIIEDIESKIGNMLNSNGYNFDYGSTDEFDPGSRTYPAVFLRYGEEIGVDEDAEDSIVGFYEAVTKLEIHVLAGSTSNLDQRMFLTRSDFQKMFKDNWSSFNGNGLERAEYEGSEQRYRLVESYPWEIVLHYNLYHRRLKNNPYHA